MENLASNCASFKKNFWVLKKSSNCAFPTKKMKLSSGGHQKIEYGNKVERQKMNKYKLNLQIHNWFFIIINTFLLEYE